jgi:hypothetical protein
VGSNSNTETLLYNSNRNASAIADIKRDPSDSGASLNLARPVSPGIKPDAPFVSSIRTR